MDAGGDENLIGASLSKPHTSMLAGGNSLYVYSCNHILTYFFHTYSVIFII